MKLKRNGFYLIVLLSLVTLNGCQSFHVANDNWQGKDKAQHFLFSMVASAGANAYAAHQNYSYREGLVIGLSFSISLGVAKELYDSRPQGTGWIFRVGSLLAGKRPTLYARRLSCPELHWLTVPGKARMGNQYHFVVDSANLHPAFLSLAEI